MSARALLESIAEEMTAVDERMGRLQHVIADLPVEAGHQAEHVRDLQDVDLVHQTLVNLADVLSRLAEALPTEATVCGEAALAGVRLSGLKARLMRAEPFEPVTSGDFEMF